MRQSVESESIHGHATSSSWYDVSAVPLPTRRKRFTSPCTRRAPPFAPFTVSSAGLPSSAAASTRGRSLSRKGANGSARQVHGRSEEHTFELQSPSHLVFHLLL